jgi:hypothetical protein
MPELRRSQQDSLGASFEGGGGLSGGWANNIWEQMGVRAILPSSRLNCG